MHWVGKGFSWMLFDDLQLPFRPSHLVKAAAGHPFVQGQILRTKYCFFTDELIKILFHGGARERRKLGGHCEP